VSQVVVAKNVFLEPSAWTLFSPADEALPTEIRKSLAECVYERPFTAFAVSHLSKALNAKLKYNENAATRPLIELAGFQDAREVASTVVDAFQTLPWQYTFIFSLGLKSSIPNDQPRDKEYVITPSISVIEAGPEFSAKFRTRDDYNLRDLILASLEGGNAQKALKPGTWKADTLYFVHRAEGFVADYFSTPLVEKTWLLLRSFGGLMRASATVEIKKEGPPSSEYSYGTSFLAAAPLHVYLAEGDEWEPLERHTGSADYADLVKSLQWILPAMEGDRVHEAFIAHIINSVKPAFGEAKECATLRQSGQWYFDSHAGTDNLLQFVQATVALEILLGDKAISEQIGLGQLLANRCAYMLAENHAERVELLDKFDEIYETRSRIVHSGKNSLNEKEWRLLHELRYLCGRLIRKELELMKPK